MVEPRESLETYKRVGDSIKDELFKFDCLQVMESTDHYHFINNATGELRIPIIYASDSHHFSQIGNPNKISYIKMGMLSIESLYEAFHYPDTRIRFINNLPSIKPPRLKGIRIIGKESDDKSFFKNIVLGFSENLSCIIGPRGCGKSAIIDSIRYSMGYNRTLGEIDKVKDQVIDRQKNTLQESRIEILFEKVDGVTHKVLATYDEKEEYVSVVHDLDGNSLSITDVEGSGEYPLNLYGWNELELLGENPKSQRDNLDRFIKDLSQLKQERANQYFLLQENYNTCHHQLEILEKYFDPSLQKTSFIRLKEFEKEYDKLNTPEIEATFKLLDSINHKLSFIDKLKLQIETSNTQLANIPLVKFDTLLEKQKGEKEWCSEELLKRLNIKEYNDLAIRYKTELSGKLQGYLQILHETRNDLEKELSSANKNIKDKVGDNVSISADLRNNAKKRFDAATEQFESYKNELVHLDELLSTRREIIKSIKSLNDQIFATRNREISNIISKIQLVEDSNFRISLKLEQDNDRSDLLEYIQSNNHNISMPGQWKRKRIPELISNKLTPFQLSESLYTQDASAFINAMEIDGEEFSIDDKYAANYVSANKPFEEITDLGVIRYHIDKMDSIMQIEQIPFDDKFYIQLNDRPIQYCSPGQRCSAMLPIVTLTSDAPIIIDQPEDNLDNRLVSRAIFKILSKLKESRQIILATHNPNILVSGDSEQVIVLKSNGEVEDFGSIDKQSIVKNIIELMEGGKEAFERRRKKYDMV